MHRLKETIRLHADTDFAIDLRGERPPARRMTYQDVLDYRASTRRRERLKKINRVIIAVGLFAALWFAGQLIRGAL